MKITLSSNCFSGTLEAISSKSDIHRILIAASLCDNPSKVYLNIFSQDIEATLSCIEELGCKLQRDKNSVTIIPPEKYNQNPHLDCNECGTTARFLLPVASVISKNTLMTGKGRLPERPFKELTEQMRGKGCSVSSDFLPMTIMGDLSGGVYELQGNISSQYISGLMFALPLLKQDSKIHLLSKLESVGYVDMTIKTLSLFGIKIEAVEDGFFIKGNQKYISPGKLFAEGDWSNSAFWLAAGAIGGEVTITNLQQNSLQGDRQICSIISEFGGDIKISQDSVTVKKRNLSGIVIDASDIPDLVPVIAVIACFAGGRTTITNAARLRLKESDRLMSIQESLSCLGAKISQTEDGLIIENRKLHTGVSYGYNDHRIVMALAVASVLCDGELTIDGANAVEKSYPHFFDDFQKIGGKISVI